MITFIIILLAGVAFAIYAFNDTYDLSDEDYARIFKE